MYDSFEPDYADNAIAYAAIIEKLDLSKADTAAKRSRRARYYILTHFDADTAAELLTRFETLIADIRATGADQIKVKVSDIAAMCARSNDAELLLGLLGCAPTPADPEIWSNDRQHQDVRSYVPTFARF